MSVCLCVCAAQSAISDLYGNVLLSGGNGQNSLGTILNDHSDVFIYKNLYNI